MRLKIKSLKLTLYLISLFFFSSGFGFSQTNTSTTVRVVQFPAQVVDSIKTQVDSLNQRITELKDEYSELKIKVANKYIDITSLILAFLALFTGGAGIAGILSWINSTNAKRASLEIKRILEEAQQHKNEFEKFVKSVEADIEVKREYVSKVIEESTSQVKDLENRLRSAIDKCNFDIQKSAVRFSETVELNKKLIFQSFIEYTNILPIEISKEKMSKIFDKVYEEQIHWYDLLGFIHDLTSKDRDERIRAILGIEGMGKKENIKDLQKIADNNDEDPDIRVEAQRSVDNMKRRFGI